MASGKQKLSVKDQQTQDQVSSAREIAAQLVELNQVPGVRNDPVVKALIHSLCPKTSDFQVASLAVSTLRNAGALTPETASSVQTSMAGPGKTGKEQKPKTGKDSEKGSDRTKLRGFDRSIDVLLEDAVYRGEFPDKESHPLAKTLRKLRSDPDRMLKVQKLQANTETGTTANGKKYVRMTGLKKDANGNFLMDGAPEEMKVKDIHDFDLLALMAPQTLQSVNDELSKKLFSWANGSYTIPENVEKAWPSLKGTPLIDLIKGGDVTQVILTKALRETKFARFSPSPTLWWNGKSA